MTTWPQPVAGSTFLVGSAGRLGAGFDLVLILHVACVAVGLATVVVSGIVAARLAATGDGAPSEQVLRYYAPGVNWAGRVLWGVPVFGFVLLGISHGTYGLDDGWVTEGLVLWLVVAGLAESLMWPAERELQVVLRGSNGAPSPPTPGEPGAPSPPTPGEPRAPSPTDDRVTIRRACRTIRAVSAVSVVAMVLATVLMVAQP